MVFYDLTSTYFEGSGPAGLARHGYSRDGKPRRRQVLVGVVRVDGWPIAHHVFRGNLRDAQTVEPVLEDLQQRFGLQRVVFVGDRGMMTSDNVERMRSLGQGYLLGLKRCRNEQVQRYIEQAQGPWQDCPAGITTSEKSAPPRTRVQEVAGDEAGVRVFVVDSEQRREYEQAQRERAMEAAREELEALAQRVASGKLKAPEKVGAAAARILDRRQRVGDQMVQRLVGSANVVRSQTGRHRLDAFALERQQQALAIALQRFDAVGMSGGARQAGFAPTQMPRQGRHRCRQRAAHPRLGPGQGFDAHAGTLTVDPPRPIAQHKLSLPQRQVAPRTLLHRSAVHPSASPPAADAAQPPSPCLSFSAGFRGQDSAKLLKTGERCSPGARFVVSQLLHCFAILSFY